jgi:hypothetical protein
LEHRDGNRKSVEVVVWNLSDTLIMAAIYGFAASLLLNMLFNLIQRILGGNTISFVDFGTVMRWGIILSIIIFVFILLKS